MNFKFISSETNLSKPVLIGKTSILRLGKNFTSLLGFKVGQKWVCAYDSEESTLKSIYFFEASDNNKHLGKKMYYINNSWNFDMGFIVKEFKLNVPLKCEIEPYKDSKYKGFKLKLL